MKAVATGWVRVGCGGLTGKARLEDDSNTALTPRNREVGMRAAVSVLLLGALLTTPIKQVLAQVEQQDSTNVVAASIGADQRSTRLIRVPEVNATTALFWRASMIDPIDSTEDAGIAWPPEDFVDYLVWGGAILAFVAVFVLIVINADTECTTIGNTTRCGPS